MIMSKIIGRVFPTAAASKPAAVEQPAADKKKPARKATKD